MNLKSSLCDLKDRALRAIAAMKTKLGPFFRKHITISLHLFDTLIRPILMYASDFWGCLKLPKNNPIENVHMRFCKELLGVQKQTNNMGVLLELGRIPLNIFGKKLCVKNWERIALQKANDIVNNSYLFNISNDTGWSRAIKDSVSRIGLMTVFINQANKPPNVLVFGRESDIFYQEAFTQIQNASKLGTLSLLKTDIGIENYLTAVPNTIERVSLSKFRLSNHTLMVVEKGRHENIKREEVEVEDEFHFLIKCQTYSPLRDKLFYEIKKNIPDFYYPPDERFLFWFLLNCPSIIPFTAHFIHSAFDLRNDLRNFLLDKHRDYC